MNLEKIKECLKDTFTKANIKVEDLTGTDTDNLSFTVGQIAIETYSQNPTIFTQGFHQDSYQITQLNDLNTNMYVSMVAKK